MGFIENLIKPAFTIVNAVLPKVEICLKTLDLNQSQWKKLESEYGWTLKETNSKSELDILPPLNPKQLAKLSEDPWDDEEEECEEEDEDETY